MTGEKRRVVWFRNNEINNGWDYNSKLNTDVFLLPFRKNYFILINEEYFLKTLSNSTDFLSDSYISTLDFIGKSKTQGFKQIHKERLSLFIRNKVFNHQEQIDTIFGEDYPKYFFFNC